MARYLANKCSIASRIDCFSGKSMFFFSFHEVIFTCATCLALVHNIFSLCNICLFTFITTEKSTTSFGDKLREQVEERLEFYDKGIAPRKNIDMMKAAMETAANQGLVWKNN